MIAALRTFLESMQAARELDEFISQSARQLNDVEALFAAEAKRRFPSDAMEQHVKAAKIVHPTIHRMMDIARQGKEEGLSDEVVKAKRDSELDSMRAQLLDLTGSPDYYAKYDSVWGTVARRRTRTSTLRASVLITIVSDFEVLIASIVRIQLALHPEILRSDEQKFSMKELEGFDSLDAFRESRAERMADGLLRGGLDDWMQWFSRRHRLDIPGVTDCPPELVEIFQRRHLHVHNGGVVNEIYRAKVKELDDLPDAGTHLRVRKVYLDRAIGMLITAAVKLTLGSALKFDPDFTVAQADHFLAHATYTLLERGEFSSVADINDWHLGFAEDSYTRVTAKVNAWLARKNIDGIDAIRDEVLAWDVETLARTFRIAKHALLDENEEAFALVESALESGELWKDSWDNWPILAGVRSYARSRGQQPLGRDDWFFSELHEDG